VEGNERVLVLAPQFLKFKLVAPTISRVWAGNGIKFVITKNQIIKLQDKMLEN